MDHLLNKWGFLLLFFSLNKKSILFFKNQKRTFINVQNGKHKGPLDKKSSETDLEHNGLKMRFPWKKTVTINLDIYLDIYLGTFFKDFKKFKIKVLKYNKEIYSIYYIYAKE